MIEERERKAIHGMSERIRRYFHLPHAVTEDLAQSATLALLKLPGKSAAYRITAARNAMLGQVSTYFGLSPGHKLGNKIPVILSFSEAEWPEADSFGAESIERLDQEKTLRLLGGMCQRHRIVVEMRFGLRGAAEHRWEALASKLGVTVIAAQSIFDEALEELREAMGVR